MHIHIIYTLTYIGYNNITMCSELVLNAIYLHASSVPYVVPASPGLKLYHSTRCKIWEHLWACLSFHSPNYRVLWMQCSNGKHCTIGSAFLHVVSVSTSPIFFSSSPESCHGK